MTKIGIFYGSTTGNTEQIAQLIRARFGEENADMIDVGLAEKSDVERYPYIILGVSTWGISDLQDDFGEFMGILDQVDLSAKKVALFGTGDQNTYSETFVDAMGILYDSLKKKNVRIVGEIPTTGYSFQSSLALVKGKLVGLAIDTEDETKLTPERVDKWVAILKEEFK